MVLSGHALFPADLRPLGLEIFEAPRQSHLLREGQVRLSLRASGHGTDNTLHGDLARGHVQGVRDR